MIACIRDIELRCAMVDPGSSLNIMPLYTIEVVGIPRDRIFKQPVKVSGSKVMHHSVFGFINLDLNVGQIQCIDALTSFIYYSGDP